MRGQEHTVMMYLVWAVFFLAALILVYTIYNNAIKTSTPSQIPQIMDTIRSAINAGKSGLSEEVCIPLTITGSITITKNFIEDQISYSGGVRFSCERGGGCEATNDSITLKDTKGRLCAKMDGILTITWR